MSILTASNLSQSFGDVDIFTGLSCTIPNDGKIGLVGPNGIGKTTLLRILAGVAQPTTGGVHLSKGSRIGYLRQEAVQAFTGREHTVYDEMLTVFAGLRAEEARLSEMEARMTSEPSKELVEEYGITQERFELAGGYEYEVRIKQVLDGLGFSSEQWQSPVKHLSGGQKTRALLGRLLLESPELMILDEPTNHLDVEAIEWLENTLRLWNGALLVVSHDRYFLDKVANYIWEMDYSNLESYRGNYSAYVKQREERWELHEQTFKSEKERLEKELDYIRRHIAGQNTDIAKGKLKRLTREIVSIEEFGFLGKQNKSWLAMGLGRQSPFSVGEADQRIRALRGPSRPPRLKMQLKAPRRAGQIVLSTKNLTIGYPTKSLFKAHDIELNRNECAALIGPNGSGKSTFLRTVLGHLPALEGQSKLGVNLNLAYFAQAHDNLNLEKSVLDELLSHHHLLLGEARNYLAQYLFRGDEIYRPVGALSGGERGRLALAILVLKGANFLLLDEPTNHLDISSQEVLQEALELFGGTILLVSHDRYLIDRLATQIWELRDGQLHIFEGSYEDHLAARERQKQQEKEAGAGARPTRTVKEASQQDASPKRSKNEIRRRAKALANLEKKMMELEEKLEEESQALQQASEAQKFDALQRLSQAYAQTQAQLDKAWSKWEALAEE